MEHIPLPRHSHELHKPHPKHPPPPPSKPAAPPPPRPLRPSLPIFGDPPPPDDLLPPFAPDPLHPHHPPARAPFAYDDVFGGPPKFASASASQPAPMQQQAPEDLAFRKPAAKVSFSAGKGASLPVFDPPLYDDDIFGGVPGVRRASVVAYEDVFSGGGFVAGPSPAAFEELLGNFGAAEPRTMAASSQRSSALNPRESLGGDLPSDELRLGFGAAEPVMPRSPQDLRPSQQTSSGLVDESSRKADDPSIVIEPDPDLLRATTFRRFSDLDPFSVASHAPDGTGKRPFFSKSIESVTRLDDIPLSVSPGSGPSKSSVNTVRDSHTSNEASSPTWSIGSMDSSEAKSMRRNYPSMKDQVKSPTIVKTEPLRSNGGYEAGAIGSPSRREQQLPLKDTVPPINHRVDETLQFSKVEKSRRVDQFWITIDDVKLATQPLAVPPPSRPPPAPISKPGFTTRNQGDAKLEHAHKTVPSFYESTGNQHEATSSWQQVRPGTHSSVKATSDDASSVLDEFEEFVSGVSRAWKDASSVQEEQQADGTAAAAAAVASATAMKEAMERAEAKFRLAKEAREREKEGREREIKAVKPRGEREKARESRERAAHEVHEREACEMHDREEREKAPREAREREERERGEKEGELMERWRREREKEKGREREREKDRIAVERAIREARERAVGRERAERVASEARERAERAAVERGSTQARERAAAETRERVLERDAVERAAAEARARAERAAVDRAAAEARERAQRSAVERAAAAKEQQRRNENNSETFFTSGSRASSAPRQRPSAVDTSSDLRQAAKGFPSEGQKRSSTGVAGVRKVASTTNMADDWSSLFSSGPAAGEFQEVEGESAERRSARWERHQRTLERTVKALEEKNQRDLQSQREQAERQRAAEILDVEIKRWATGKEGNLRALLATLHYILWPECGWQPVSLTDLITSAAVKKAYRKATLCVHPDKVQQKGATIQQKYAAEKVFDLLKEGWNKFNAEELF